MVPCYVWVDTPYVLTGSVRPRVGDFDGDGHADVLLFGLADGMGVLLGDGTGALADPILTALAEPAHGSAVGDFDADGLTDVFLSVEGAPPRVEFYEALGDGTFTMKAAFDSAYSTVGTDHAVGDFDGDGDLDAATLHQGVDDVIAKHVGSFTNKGGGAWGFKEQQFPELKSDILFDAWPGIMLSINISGDHEELLAADQRSVGVFSRLRTDGQGGFVFIEKYNGLSMAHDAVAHDLEGDGVDELAGLFYGSPSVALFKKNGAWSSPDDNSYGYWGQAAAIGEVLRDPRSDLVILWDNLLGAAALNLDGSVDVEATLWIGGGIEAFALADLNEDGNSDFVVSMKDSHKVTLRLSE